MTQPVKPSSWLVNLAIFVVLLGFVAAIGYAVIEQDWHAVEIISPELLLTLGFLFGVRIVKGGGS